MKHSTAALFATLPEEIVVCILKSLLFADLLSASCVCRRWHKLASDPAVWGSLTLSFDDLHDSSRCSSSGDKFRRTSRSRRIRLSLRESAKGPCSIQTLRNRFGARFAHVRRLCLSTHSLIEGGAMASSALCEVLALFPNTDNVDLTNNRAVDDRALASLLAHCSRLRVLKLYNCIAISVNGFAALMGSQSSTFSQSPLTTLTSLDLSGTKITDHLLLQILFPARRDARATPLALTHLALSRCCYVTKFGFTSLMRFLSRCPSLSQSLRVLDLSNNLLEDTLDATKSASEQPSMLAPLKLPHLVWLNVLHVDNLTLQDVSRFSSRHPKCLVSQNCKLKNNSVDAIR